MVWKVHMRYRDSNEFITSDIQRIDMSIGLENHITVILDLNVLSDFYT